MRNCKRLIVYPAALLLMMAGSCRKEAPETVIKGHVVDVSTSAPVANATVAITSSDPWTGGNSTQLALLHTDANGDFTYTFTPEEGLAYQYAVDGGDYVPPGWVAIMKYRHNNITTKLTPHAYLKVTVRDTSSITHDVTLGSFCPGCVYVTPLNVDSLVGVIQIPWQETYTVEWATANGTLPVIYHSMQVHLTPHGVTPVLLEY